jgi:hypothetical protein
MSSFPYHLLPDHEADADVQSDDWQWDDPDA